MNPIESRAQCSTKVIFSRPY